MVTCIPPPDSRVQKVLELGALKFSDSQHHYEEMSATGINFPLQILYIYLQLATLT